jgi:hypothetical protein
MTWRHRPSTKYQSELCLHQGWQDQNQQIHLPTRLEVLSDVGYMYMSTCNGSGTHISHTIIGRRSNLLTDLGVSPARACSVQLAPKPLGKSRSMALNSTEKKKQDKAAAEVIASFGNAIDEAFASEIQYIVSELQKNKPLTYTLSGLLKKDSLVALLDGRLQAASAAASSQRPARADVVRRLRSTATRFRHILETKGVVDDIIKKVMPAGDHDAIEALTCHQKLDVVCVLLGVNKQTFLPDKHYKNLSEVANLLSACSQRFDKVMKETVGDKPVDELLQGWSGVQPDGKLTAVFKNKDGEPVAIAFPGKITKITDPFDLNTTISVDVQGTAMMIHDVKESFVAQDVEFPEARCRQTIVPPHGCMFGSTNDQVPMIQPMT